MKIDSLSSFTLAIVFLFLGKYFLSKSQLLRRISIPESVVGGFGAALIVWALYFLFDLRIDFSLEVQNTLLLYFFAGVGLRADLRDLRTGGRQLFGLILLVSFYLLIQNLLGIAVASAFGVHPKLGLMVGSISLTGGMGTTMAWAPEFSARGITNALEIGVASSALGLIAACLLGGPLADWLIRRFRLKGSQDSNLEVGVAYRETHTAVDTYGILWAWLWLNVSLILGKLVDFGIAALGVNLPMFVSCLIAGLLLSNTARMVLPKWDLSQGNRGLAILSDISLGMFLVMSLMGLHLWELWSAAAFLTVAIALQVVLAAVFAATAVFFTMGRNYEAAVIAAGFTGLNLGTTATALVSMTAITKQHGAAHRAFLLIPILGGFFIGLVNGIVIQWLLDL